MKIENIKAAYSQQIYPLQKTAAENRLADESIPAEKSELFTKDEKKYFEDMFPGMDAESHVKNNYKGDGRVYTFSLGRTFDKKG